MAIKYTKDSWKLSVLFLKISFLSKEIFLEALNSTQRRVIWSWSSAEINTFFCYHIDTWLFKLHSCTVLNQLHAKLINTCFFFFFFIQKLARESKQYKRKERGICVRNDTNSHYWLLSHGSDSRFCLFVVKYIYIFFPLFSVWFGYIKLSIDVWLWFQAGMKENVCGMERGAGSWPSAPNSSPARRPSRKTCNGWTVCKA